MRFPWPGGLWGTAPAGHATPSHSNSTQWLQCWPGPAPDGFEGRVRAHHQRLQAAAAILRHPKSRWKRWGENQGLKHHEDAASMSMRHFGL